DDAVSHLLEIGRIDAALKRIGSPQTERVRPLVAMRAGDEDIREAGQALANVFDDRIEQSNEIDRSQCDFALAVAEYDGAGHERIMNASGDAILAKSGDID